MTKKQHFIDEINILEHETRLKSEKAFSVICCATNDKSYILKTTSEHNHGGGACDKKETFHSWSIELFMEEF